ncbi:MAG TPA: response regulator transcription factor [Taishania sp.]|nr:response regulator transcription factor [Taishania sp.]HNS42852.1 response regulator transcription factor [Taishania sp.]
MKGQKILLVDDDQNISEILEFNLKSEGFDVTSVYSAEEALQQPIASFNLLLLDVMMGGMSGYKLAEKLRNDNITVPIIFLTAKDTENDMLTGFSVGGDDYISKPFSIKEVIARIKAILKRSNAIETPKQENASNLIIGDLKIDFTLKEIYIANEKIGATKTEFEILSLLAQKSDKIFSRQEIIDILWSDTPYITERTVDVHITRLRKKLKDYASIITNRSGYGYRFNKDVN